MLFNLKQNNSNKNQKFIGRQFDKDGNANMWWDDETIKKFEEHAQCFIDMYQNYNTPELVPPMKPEEAHVCKYYIHRLYYNRMTNFFKSTYRKRPFLEFCIH